MNGTPLHAPIRLAAERQLAMVNVASIDVVSSRGRGSRQFKENVRSIEHNGLYKPIVVNARNHAATGRYELVCGEGRLKAHVELKREAIQAEIINVDLATAHLMSLGENMTKCRPSPVEYAYSLLEMHERGTTIEELERITGYTPQYIRSYITLVKQGEERLIKGVETGIFTLEFARRVAESTDGTIQHILMDAYDRKMITAKHVDAVRKIMAERTKNGKEVKGSNRGYSRTNYTVDDLKRDIQRITKEKEQYAAQIEAKETRMFRMMEALRKIRSEPTVMAMLKHHNIENLPNLEAVHA